MHRVLNTPEILDIIFGYTDGATDVACTTVNKNFFEASTKSLWFNLEKLQRVFCILSPIVKVGDGSTSSYKFSYEPRFSHWNRFYLYTSKTRIRRITVDEGTWNMNQVYQEAARSRTQFHLFPNLTGLRITLNPIMAQNAILYVHENLQKIMVRVEVSDHASLLASFLAAVGERVRCLSEFHLQGDYSSKSAEKALVQFFSEQSDLEYVALPLFTNTALVMSRLALLPKLKMIEFHFEDSITNKDWGLGDKIDVASFSPSLPKGSFPQLHTLEFAARIQDARRFFSMKYAPANITTLYFYVIDMATAKLITDCFKALADTCENLRDVTLDMIREIVSNPIESVSAVTFDSFGPLLKMKKMRTFRFFHPRPFLWTCKDIELLAQSWSKLNALDLNSNPLIQDTPSLDLSCLESIAEHMPYLTELSIYLNAGLPVSVPDTEGLLESLEQLSFGSSVITNPDAVAIYLNHMLDQNCELDVDDNGPWREEVWENVEEKHLEERAANVEQWKEVKRLLPIMAKATQKYKDTIAGLKEKIRILSKDSGIL